MSALCFLSNLIERISVCTRTMIYLGWYLKCVQLVSSAVKKKRENAAAIKNIWTILRKKHNRSEEDLNLVPARGFFLSNIMFAEHLEELQKT